jgi:hypothetical protein
VTPFDSWYSANIEANLPRDMPDKVRQVAKVQAAQIWNAAVDQEMAHPELDNYARVTP